MTRRPWSGLPGGSSVFLLAPALALAFAFAIVSASTLSLYYADSSYELVTPGLRVEETNTVFLRCLVHAHGACLDGRVK